MKLKWFVLVTFLKQVSLKACMIRLGIWLQEVLLKKYFLIMASIAKNQKFSILTTRREVDVPVDWTGDNNQRVPPQKFKVFY